jgi:hypothetical protein
MLASAGSGPESLVATSESGALWQPVMVAIPARVAIPIAKVKTYLLLDLESIAVIVLCPLSGLTRIS